MGALGLSAYAWLVFQKGWTDLSTLAPLAPVVVMLVLELLKRRDTRSEKERDREAALDDRTQKIYEREIESLEKRLAVVCEERDELREQLRPQGQRKGGGE